MAVQTYKAKIEKIIQETPYSKTFTLDLGKDIEFLPGQFVMIEFANKLPGVRRAYSISSPPSLKKTITITLKKEGAFTTALDESLVGEEILVKGPMGLFTLDASQKKDIVFIAGGTGIAPFRSMIHYLLDNKMPNKMTVFYSTKNPEEFIFFRELNELQAMHPQLTVVFTATRCTEPTWNGFCERVSAEMIARTVANCKECIYYLCGPLKMVQDIETTLLQMGIDKKNIKAERWG